MRFSANVSSLFKEVPLLDRFGRAREAGFSLERLGYDGHVGLEYNPTTQTTEESLGWLPKELRGKDVAVLESRL